MDATVLLSDEELKERKKTLIGRLVRLGLISLIFIAFVVSLAFPYLQNYNLTYVDANGQIVSETADFTGFELVAAAGESILKIEDGGLYGKYIIGAFELNVSTDFSALALIYLVPFGLLIFLLLWVGNIAMTAALLFNGKYKKGVANPLNVILLIAGLAELAALMIFQTIYCDLFALSFGFYILGITALLAFIYPAFSGYSKKKINEELI
ncbi:MAG: hypothetical protein LBQ40_07745 [Clostridiales bacterium]|jgi:hypothetical protein|nr:hypothetical protein [Clostridiales bacterium]